MMYDDNFILSLPDDFNLAIINVVTHLNQDSGRNDDDIREARDLVVSICNMHDRPFNQELVTRISGTDVFNLLQIVYSSAQTALVTERSTSRQERFLVLLGKSFHYSLSEPDLKRIQELINELRTMITNSSEFEADHKRRVLERLEQLQTELHRRLSSLDRFYGLIGDAGVIFGKFGTDAKPFVDRIREIVEIIWRSQAGAEELPASAKPALITTDSTSSPTE